MRNLTFKSLLFVLFTLISNMVYSQTQIKGKVIDDTNFPLPGVTIKIDGTSVGTITDLAGNYMINAPETGKLIFSFTGFEKQIVDIAGQTTINIQLKPLENTLEDVIVVGYGTQNRNNFTGSVGSVQTDALKEKPISNIEEALQGRVTGLSISSTGGQPGGATKMNIRGITSVSGSSQPLIVVDGFPISDVTTSGGGNLEANSSQMSSFSYINPDDIQSIEVLKDASATAIYGNRGANGVIMITTKSGKKGNSGITYSSYYGIQEMKKRIEVMSFADYAKYQQTTNPTNRLFTATDGTPRVFPDADLMNVNWQDQVYRRGITQNHSLTLQGKSDKTSFAFSTSYNRNKSVLMETDFKKFTNRVSVDHEFSKRVTIGGNITYSNILNIGKPTDGREGTAAGVVISSLIAKPYKLDMNTQARFRRAGVPQSILDGWANGISDDPDDIANNTKMDKRINRLIGNFYSNFQLLDWLSFKTTVGVDFYSLKDQQFYSTKTPWGALNNGIAATAGINAMNLANENYFTVSKTFDVHTINLVSGVSFQSSKNEFFRAEARDFKNEVLGYNSLQGASQFLNSSSVDELFMASFLARANYSFSDRYLATLSFRRDGTSRFISEKWGNFYSGALAWNIKNEAFLKDNALISTLKLRTSIGQVGNASVPIQGALLDQTYSNYTFNGQIANGVSPSNLENRNLTWETTQQQNTGLDFGLFNDNLNFTVDYYVTKTKDLLLLTPVTISTGFSQGWFNIGEIQNSGLEFSIDYSLKTKSDFVWNTKLNFTTTKNEIKALGSNGEPIYIDVNYDAICTDEVILKVGGSINDLYGYQTEGIYKPEDFNADGTPKTGVATAGAGEKAGDIKYKDLNSDGKIDGFDRTVIGNTTAKIFGSWSNNFAYKGFDFDFVFQYSYGNDVFNASKTRISSFASGTSNQTTDWLNRWTPENSGSTQYAGVPSLRPADYLVEDGSFIRLQSVSFGYNLPSSWTSKAKMKSVKVYFTANNLALFTKYSGYDPEVTSNQVDHRYSFVQGFDYGGFPRAKTYMMGVKIQF